MPDVNNSVLMDEFLETLKQQGHLEGTYKVRPPTKEERAEGSIAVVEIQAPIKCLTEITISFDVTKGDTDDITT